MTAADRLAKRALDALDSDGATAARSILSDHLSRSRGKKQRAAAREPRAPGRSIEERRAERAEQSASIREAAMERSGGSCEFCGALGMVLEEHHILGGSSRSSSEAVNTVAMICADCHHRGWHKNKPETFRLALAWATKHGSAEAVHAIRRRLAKVDRTQRPSVPIRVEVAP